MAFDKETLIKRREAVSFMSLNFIGPCHFCYFGIFLLIAVSGVEYAYQWRTSSKYVPTDKMLMVLVLVHF